MTLSEPPVVAIGDVRRLHPLTPFFGLILWLRQFFVPLVVLVVANRGERAQLLTVVPLSIGFAAGVLQWLRFTYTLDGRRLVIDEGVFTRKQRVVPLDRIQQVETVTKLRHRIFGVTVVRVDAAGGTAAAEVELSVVSVAEGDRLRSALHPAAAGGPTAPAPAAAVTPSRTLVALGTGRLALAGMTGSELAVILTILFWVLQLVDDLPDSFVQDMAGHVTAPSSAAGFLAAVGITIVVWFGLAAAASVLKNHGFTLRRVGDDLRVTRGLLDQREGTMPVHRLQAVRVQETMVRRALHLAEVVLQSAGGAGAGARGVSRIDVPILAAGDVGALMVDLLPAPPPDPSAYVPAPPAARRRAVLRRVVPALSVAIALGLWAPAAVPAAAALVGLAALSGEVAYRGLAHAWQRDLLAARAGGLARETVIVPAAKAQSTRLRTTPFQRRAGVATLHVDVAGRGRTPQIRDGDAARLRALQRAVLVASPAARDDERRERRRHEVPSVSA